ncbi:hypothetical protein [Shouchella clausii]|nr:hypothetical protein [Shouchella clausii]
MKDLSGKYGRVIVDVMILDQCGDMVLVKQLVSGHSYWTIFSDLQEINDF